MSDKLSEEDFNWIREFYNEDTKYYFPNRLIAEIDRLRAEGTEQREAIERLRSENKQLTQKYQQAQQKAANPMFILSLESQIAELREIVRECREKLRKALSFVTENTYCPSYYSEEGDDGCECLACSSFRLLARIDAATSDSSPERSEKEG